MPKYTLQVWSKIEGLETKVEIEATRNQHLK